MDILSEEYNKLLQHIGTLVGRCLKEELRGEIIIKDKNGLIVKVNTEDYTHLKKKYTKE